ncbi:MAG TPA: metallophosphoesterase [Propionibacterium sp.]|jgi:predicted MPP superfamily phosphohydrolase|nr:metallophosphoesterase [Propionibacterium sp.]
MTSRRTDGSLKRVLGGTVALGVGGIAYGALIESRAFVLRRFSLPLLPNGADPVRVLHLSDMHLLPRQRAKVTWVRGLADLKPDLVVNTGDNHAHPHIWPWVLEAYGRLLDLPGVYVWGSNDYLQPLLKNPLDHLGGPKNPTRLEDHPGRELPWRTLGAHFDAAGWSNLVHRRETLSVRGMPLAFRGTDDAHSRRDRYELVTGPPDPTALINIAVTHAPYLRLLDAFASDGMDLILAGHTHGGQVCVPGHGALVTNCDLDTKRAKGVSQHTSGGHTSVLHVSGGLGVSPFGPVRFACRPEASLLTLVARDHGW